MKESTIQKLVRLAASKRGYVVWRNNVGVAYQGGIITMNSQEARLRHPRRISFGVGGAGGSDLIGYREVVVTQEMVGHPVAVFCAIECKRPGGRGPTPDQKHFQAVVNKAGGVAIVARGESDIP